MPPEDRATASKLRLLIADDQPLIRRALSMTLGAEPDIEVVGLAANGQEAIDLALRLQPQVVIMDQQMPGVSGAVATREITTRLPDVRIVILTTFDDDELVFEAIRSGAHAYLLKDATEDVVLETVRAVHQGESRLSPTIARKVLAQLRALSGREDPSPDTAPRPAATSWARPLPSPAVARPASMPRRSSPVATMPPGSWRSRSGAAAAVAARLPRPRNRAARMPSAWGWAVRRGPAARAARSTSVARSPAVPARRR
ncbi:response regulator transcription factor [Alcaligenaceae bacterium SAGV3]|nr:response regulator transcription factor [Alcaligenaceae bacterium SAGV3]